MSLAAIGDYLAEGAITVNARGAVTYANRVATGLLGLRAESLLGRDVLSLAGPTHGDATSLGVAVPKVRRPRPARARNRPGGRPTPFR